MEPRSAQPGEAAGGDQPSGGRGPDRLGWIHWLVIAAGALLAAPGVLLDALGGVGPLGPVLVGPLVEETLKPAGLIIVLTRRPRVRPAAWAGLLAGALSGLVFAAVENGLYLTVYVPEPTGGLIAWRWTVCVALHVACSAIVGCGLARGAQAAARRSDRAYELLAASAPQLLDSPHEASGVFEGPALKALAAAVAVHGAYNAGAIAWAALGG